MAPDPIQFAAAVVRRRWAPAILDALSERPCRYLDLHRQLATVSQKVLTEHLRALERSGVLTRTSSADSPKVLYWLTPHGAELHELIGQLRNWGAALNR